MAAKKPAGVADDQPFMQPGRPRLRHEIETFVVGQSNQLAYNTALYVAEFPGAQYNPLFHPRRLRIGQDPSAPGVVQAIYFASPDEALDLFDGRGIHQRISYVAARRTRSTCSEGKMRELDLLVIDDVHFLGGKKATQEEFLHTFNAIEAMGRQVVMASDDHPKMIEEFGESLINRFVSGMVVRIDPPNFATRCEILRSLSPAGRDEPAGRSGGLDRPAGDAERPRAGRGDHPQSRPSSS